MEDLHQTRSSNIKTRITQVDRSIPIITLIMIIAGLSVQLLTSGEDIGRFMRYVAVVPFGVMAMAATCLLGHSFILKHWKTALFAVLGVSVLLILRSTYVNGTYVHIKSIIILSCPIMALAVFCFSNRGYRGILLSEMCYVIFAGICAVANSALELLIISTVFITIMIVSIVKDSFHVNKRVASAMLVLPMLAIMLFSQPMLRVLAATWRAIWNQGYDPHGTGFQGIVVRQIISHSNAWGPFSAFDGPFANKPMENHILPGWNTDFVLTYLVGKHGYIFGLIIVVLFAVFVWRLFAAALHQTNTLSLLLSLSAVIPIAIMGLIFIAANLGLSGTPSAMLPIISTRSASYVVTMTLIGLTVTER